MIYEIRDYTIEEQWFEKYVFGQGILCRMLKKELT